MLVFSPKFSSHPGFFFFFEMSSLKSMWDVNVQMNLWVWSLQIANISEWGEETNYTRESPSDQS